MLIRADTRYVVYAYAMRGAAILRAICFDITFDAYAAPLLLDAAAFFAPFLSRLFDACCHCRHAAIPLLLGATRMPLPRYARRLRMMMLKG